LFFYNLFFNCFYISFFYSIILFDIMFVYIIFSLIHNSQISFLILKKYILEILDGIL
jgi:hypothetical protein